MWFIILILIIIVAIIAKGIRIVPESKAIVVERLGTYKATLHTGVHVILPVLENVRSTVNLKEQLRDFPPQPVITKDNVTMQIDTVVYFQIVNPKLYVYGIENPINAIENLTATTLRNIIGELELDQTLTSRDTINSKMCEVLDLATDGWGIKVNRVEVKNIMPPRDIQESMEKQMRAERERREKILQAEGEKKSAILLAEGEKESAILRAESEKEAKILRATGEAEALRIQKEAEAAAIVKMKNAEAEGLKSLKNAQVDANVLKLKAYEALVGMASNPANTIIVPTELQGLTSAALTVKETVKNNNQNDNKKN